MGIKWEEIDKLTMQIDEIENDDKRWIERMNLFTFLMDPEKYTAEPVKEVKA